MHRGPVVPVQVDVQRAEGQLSSELVFQHLAETDGEVDPAPLDAQQYGLFTVSVTFHDLAGETVENAGDLVGMKKDGGFHGATPLEVRARVPRGDGLPRALRSSGYTIPCRVKRSDLSMKYTGTAPWGGSGGAKEA